MSNQALVQLAQDLEWLGCELEYCGQKHAMEGFPGVGPTWEAFLEKQRGVLVTVDKIARELKSVVRFDPVRLMGVDYPVEATVDSIADRVAAIEEIRHTAVFAVHELPQKVRAFTHMVETYSRKVSPARG